MTSRRHRLVPHVVLVVVLLIADGAAASCLQPDVPENCHTIFVDTSPFPTGTLAKYNCALGYERIGLEERTCLASGEWSGIAPICAIDVAANKPTTQSSNHQTSQNAVQSIPSCALTDSAKSSWWSVDLLGTFDVRAVSITLGHLSSDVADIRLESDNGTITSCESEVKKLKNSTTLLCSADAVRNVIVHAQNRLHLCSIKVFAVNAQSSWQCALPSMDVLTVHDNNCYSASRMEKLDWKSAQKRCLDLGGTLPLRINAATQIALSTALSTAQSGPSFYWIGLMGTSHGWRWADGEVLDDHFEEWYEEPSDLGDGETLAAVMGRPASWKWMTAAQSVWNPWICQTKPKFCTSPGVAANGRVVFSSQSYAIGTYSFYSCETGFELIGSHRRRCQSDGRWSESIPLCKAINCGYPADWSSHGTIHFLNGSTAFSHQIEYRCRRGTELAFNATAVRQCNAEGVWSGEEPKCTEIDCGKPPQIAHGTVGFNETSLNSSAAYRCDESYRLIGHEKSFCSESGVWYPAPPVCYDMNTLKEINDSTAVTSDRNVSLAVLIVILLAILLLVAFTASQYRFRDSVSSVDDTPSTFNGWLRRGIVCGGKSPASDGPRHLVYAAPSQHHESTIYYAPTGLGSVACTQIELPPHLLHMQQLPNGNIHVTLPPIRPVARPSLLNAGNLLAVPPRPPPPRPPSPTASQLLYSFDHEPIYDQPPDNIYEELSNPNPPKPPHIPPPLRRDNTEHTVC